jgi:reactive intermediate/imine deaminase
MDGENDFLPDAAASGPAPTPGPRHVDVPALARPGGHYSHAAVGAGLVFIAGQLPITPAGVRLVDAGFDEQAAQVLANVRAALLAAGSGIDKLLQVRVYIDDMAHWPAFDRLYTQWAGSARPARAVVPTGPLHFGLKVEVEATALA